VAMLRRPLSLGQLRVRESISIYILSLYQASKKLVSCCNELDRHAFYTLYPARLLCLGKYERLLLRPYGLDLRSSLWSSAHRFEPSKSFALP